jgi:hypothetical protein
MILARHASGAHVHEVLPSLPDEAKMHRPHLEGDLAVAKMLRVHDFVNDLAAG